ncbi:MAG: META domain-containing protein [Snodgrassella sp.]|nr:META domain-containing protein [Snodgrassella sp.]
MKSLILRFISIVAICTFGGCAFADKPNAKHLSGNWEIRTLNNEPLPDTNARIRFDHHTHQYYAYFGCNHIYGSYRDYRHKLVLSQPFGITKLCQNIEDERTGTGTLSFVSRWRIINDSSGVRLNLLDKDNYVRLEARLIKEDNNQPKK